VIESIQLFDFIVVSANFHGIVHSVQYDLKEQEKILTIFQNTTATKEFQSEKPFSGGNNADCCKDYYLYTHYIIDK